MPYAKRSSVVLGNVAKAALKMMEKFYEQIVCTKVFCTAFSNYFVLIWQNNIGTKAACKMLVKLSPGVVEGRNEDETLLRRGLTSFLKHLRGFLQKKWKRRSYKKTESSIVCKYVTSICKFME